LKKKLLIAQFILIPLLGSNLYAQDNFENLRKRGRPFEQMILGAALRHSVDPHLLWTIAYLESRFRPEAISYKNGRPCALGLMQFIPSTAQEYGLKNPYDPQEAVDAAARYVRRLLRRFDGRTDLVLAAYNAGEGTVEAYRDGRRLVLKDGRIINPIPVRTGGVPPYTETQSYVARGRLIYQTISRQQLFTPPSKSSGLDSREARVETSIYISNLGSGVEGMVPQSKGSRNREGPRTLSFYAK
jgi:soluble lytic murein transglycosylase-like protein